MLSTQLCPTLCYPMDCSLPRSSVLGDFSRQEYRSGLPCPPPGDLLNPGIKPRSPTLQVDSLPSESPGKPKNTGVGYHALLQGLNPAGNPGTEPRSPTLQVDSLPSESPGKPKNTGRPSIITIVLLYSTAPLTDFLSLVSWSPFCCLFP